jgi:hypothetical protein
MVQDSERVDDGASRERSVDVLETGENEVLLGVVDEELVGDVDEAEASAGKSRDRVGLVGDVKRVGDLKLKVENQHRLI